MAKELDFVSFVKLQKRKRALLKVFLSAPERFMLRHNKLFILDGVSASDDSSNSEAGNSKVLASLEPSQIELPAFKAENPLFDKL